MDELRGCYLQVRALPESGVVANSLIVGFLLLGKMGRYSSPALASLDTVVPFDV